MHFQPKVTLAKLNVSKSETIQDKKNILDFELNSKETSVYKEEVDGAKGYVEQEKNIDISDAQAFTVETENNDIDDDPVVREIQVYINRVSIVEKEDNGTSTHTSPLTYLLQYPLRPSGRPYGDHGQLTTVKYRKQQNVLCLEYTLNTDEHQFCSSRSKDSTENSEQALREDRQRLVGISCTSPHLSYGIGLLRGDHLYLTPVTSVLQLRPDFAYMDHEDDLDRKRLTSQSDIINGGDATDSSMKSADISASDASGNKIQSTSLKSNKVAEKSSKKQPTFKSPVVLTRQHAVVIPPESDWHRYPVSKIRDLLLNEPWEEIESFYHQDSCESFELIELFTSFSVPVISDSSDSTYRQEDPAIALLGVTSTNSTQSMSEEHLTKSTQVLYERVKGGSRVPKLCFSSHVKSYLEKLCNVRELQSGVLLQDLQSSGPLSYLQLCRLPCDKQIFKILQHLHVETTEGIESLLTKKIPHEEFISHLQAYADLILGNWVCQSSFLYEGLTAYCRDFLIFLFSTGRSIVRETVKPYMGGLSSVTLTTLLKELGVYRDNAWHFKFPVHEATMAKYPHLVKKSEQKFSKDAIKVLLTKIQGATLPQKKDVKAVETSKDSSLDCEGNSGGIPSLVLHKVITEALVQHGIQTTTSLTPLVRHYLARHAETLESTVKYTFLSRVTSFTEEELASVLPQLAETVGSGFWALRKHPSTEINKYRNILLNIVKRMTLRTESEEALKGITRTNVLQEFENYKMRWEFPDFVFRQLMKEFFINHNGYWVFKGNMKPKSVRAE